MAISSNRSPSPLSSKRRNPDSNSAPRRSFPGNQFPRPPALSNPRNSWNPVTPANSPATGFGRKTPQVHDEKENEKDPAPAKSSPAMSGTKSFMAPTISAASKFTPSPRKKVLVERNDPVRTSITLSDGKAAFFSGLESPVRNTELKDDVVSTSKGSKKVTFSDGCVSKNYASSPIIAPLDADPFVLPYDPKTNFYSPRPQFLHYKPNPRIEVLLDQEMGDELGIPRSLEDNLLEVLSESSSDTDSTEGSISGDDSQKDSEDVLPEGAEEEDLRVPESTIEEVLEENEGEIIPNLSEIDGVSEGNADEAKEEEAFEAVKNNNGRHKKSFWKPFFVLLVLLVTGASLWADVSPFMSSSVFEALESPKIDVFRKENLDELGTRLQKLSFDSISHLSLLMNKLGGGGGHYVGDVHFLNLNLTTDSEDHNGFSICPKDERKVPEQIEEDIEEEEEEEEQSESEVQILAPTYAEMDSDDIEDWESEDFTELEGDESVTDPSILEETSRILEADTNVASSAEKEPEVTTETVHSVVEDTSSDNVVLPENLDHERIKVVEEPEIASETANPVEEEEGEDASSEKLQDSIFQIIAPLVAAAIVSAAALFVFWKRSIRASDPKVVDSVPKKMVQHFSAEEGSGSSEMSSSRSDVQDKRARKRRDSMASSSSDFSAYSYGSFTTYEKISSKNAIGEGEILTPVRRSSRIRSHVSS